MGGVIEQPMTKIVDAVEALYGRHGTLPARYPAFLRVARPHRPEKTSQGIASSGHAWMHVRAPQRSRMATEKREPLSAQKRPCWQALCQSSPPVYDRDNWMVDAAVGRSTFAVHPKRTFPNR